MNRLVPVWPEINENCITPSGFGDEKGNQPCFSTEINSCSIYLPYKLVQDLSRAKSIFEQIIPTLKDMWPNCGDRIAKVKINGNSWRILLYFAFGHILIKPAK